MVTRYIVFFNAKAVLPKHSAHMSEQTDMSMAMVTLHVQPGLTSCTGSDPQINPNDISIYDTSY